MISKFITQLRALYQFIITLLGPLDKIDSICSRGHKLLKDWTHCPHCKLINRAEDLSKQSKMAKMRAPSVALYCLSGSQKGNFYILNNEVNSISCEANSNIVLTPESLNSRARYQILINGKIRLSSSDTNSFKLNGQRQQSATLFDFDELELLDNRFLIMDLRNNSGAHHAI